MEQRYQSEPNYSQVRNSNTQIRPATVINTSGNFHIRRSSETQPTSEIRQVYPNSTAYVTTQPLPNPSEPTNYYSSYLKKHSPIKTTGALRGQTERYDGKVSPLQYTSNQSHTERDQASPVLRTISGRQSYGNRITIEGENGNIKPVERGSNLLENQNRTSYNADNQVRKYFQKDEPVSSYDNLPDAYEITSRDSNERDYRSSSRYEQARDKKAELIGRILGYLRSKDESDDSLLEDLANAGTVPIDRIGSGQSKQDLEKKRADLLRKIAEKKRDINSLKVTQ